MLRLAGSACRKYTVGKRDGARAIMEFDYRTVKEVVRDGRYRPHDGILR